ncbi:unnamed protein product [Brachionus calyciflorus]|uniref:Uncharacterized protein n=1 Tax=Brachionus calyciflorus TaxID=104777 RepID=A0A813NS21_9BILA|nr:unnamed protein product [Brachionus calyciflorus]
MDTNFILGELEQSFQSIDKSILLTRQKEHEFDSIEYRISNYLSNTNYFVAKMNESRFKLIEEMKTKMLKDLESLTRNDKVEKIKFYFNHLLSFSIFEFIGLSYINDFSLINKLKYLDFYNPTNLIQVPMELQNKSNYQIHPMTNLKYFLFNTNKRELSLMSINSCDLKKLKLPDDKYCNFHVYKSNMFCVICSLNFEEVILQVYDFSLNLIKSKQIEPGYIYFFNSNLVNYSKSDKNEHQIFDCELNQKFTLKNVYRNPLIDYVNDRIMFLEDERDGLHLKIITFTDNNLIGKVKINTASSFSIIIDEESNIYIRMMDLGSNLMHIYCYDSNATFLFKKYVPNLDNFHSIKLISPNQIAFLELSTNNFALF